MATIQSELGARNTERFLTFFLGAERYGVSIMAVKEIIALMKTTRIPKSPAFLRGVMNLRGVIIPVVDLRKRFGMPEAETTDQSAVIIIKIREDNIGFAVDRVEEVVNATEDQMSEPTAFGDGVDSGCVSKMIRTEKSVIMVMDLENIFSEKELEQLQHTTVAAQG